MDDVAGERRRRILVVEDEAITAMDIERLLTDFGYEVCDVIDSAPEAVEAAGSFLPDLVLMDIRLAGGTDGVCAASEIRQRFGIASVFLTAHNDPATLARAEGAAPLDFIMKPYSRAQLEDAMRQAVARIAALGC